LNKYHASTGSSDNDSDPLFGGDEDNWEFLMIHTSKRVEQ